MKNTIRRSIVLFIFLVFLLPSITISSADNLKVTILSDKTNSNEISCVEKSYTIYRFAPDGSITPLKVDIDTNENQDIGELIADKCEELFEKDIEMQKLIEIELENLTFGFVCKVKSHGRGFHYKSMVLEKILSRFVLFRLGLPRLTTILHNPLVLCRYAKDTSASTKITQLYAGNDTANKTMIIDGNHTVIAQNFIGYTTWIGRFSKSFLDIVPRAFSGIARFVVCIKLN